MLKILMNLMKTSLKMTVKLSEKDPLRFRVNTSKQGHGDIRAADVISVTVKANQITLIWCDS